MDSRFLVFLLTTLAAASLLGGCGRGRLAVAEDGSQPPVVEPELDRREIEPAKIDTEDFEIGFRLGQISVEDFGVNTVTGLRFAYHITEGFFVEASGGMATTQPTSFERLSGAAQLLTEDERDYSYYDLSMGYNVFPGESFVGKGRAFNTSLYLIAGVGNTTFAGDDRFTINYGLGARLMPLDWLAIHADIRNYMFDIDLLGQEKTTNNMEFTLGLTFFF